MKLTAADCYNQSEEINQIVTFTNDQGFLVDNPGLH